MDIMKLQEKWNPGKLVSPLLVLVGNLFFALTVKLFIMPAKLISICCIFPCRDLFWYLIL